jgi:hypothetical protein
MKVQHQNAPDPFLKRSGLIDEHNGDVIPNFVNQPARFADQPVFGVVEVNFPLALGACKNVKQFLVDSHP